MNGLTRWRRKTTEPTEWAADPFERLQREINRLFDFDRWGWDETTGIFDRTISPPMDIVEKPDSIVVTCDLPGVDKKDLDISISGNVLTIKGEKKEEKEEKETQYYRKESWSGSFQRTVSLPNTVDADKVEAVMKDGVLRLTMPKKEEAKRKQIPVSVK
ncbi:MAG: Hsp20/alpha crystallin family protein [Spirochaetes bacterium]|nr:MAG: Hsp20/alpha crystallin family protein [Spirochaetota bacterium]